MPSVGQCPHCGEEFNENDLEEVQLYRDFKKLCNQEVLKKNRRIKRFLGSPLPVVLVFFMTYWVDRHPRLLIGILLLVVAIFLVPKIMSRQEAALFERYKKDFSYPPKDLS